MWCGKTLGVVFLVGLSGVLVSACGDEGCNPDTVERASAFLDSHQRCNTDEDCVIVSDYCGEIQGGFCGQLTMNHEGASSREWRALDAELRDCGPGSCVECGAALTPGCRSGSCRGP
jgi:hypothetical protein